VRRFTPYSVRVPAVAHAVTLTKRNYLDTTVYIPPDVTVVAVAMRPSGDTQEPREARTESEPSTRDQPRETAAPRAQPGVPWITVTISVPGRQELAGAEVWARASGESNEQWLGITDGQGELKAQLPEGNYDLLVYLDAWSGIRKRVKVRADRNRPITIDLRR